MKIPFLTRLMEIKEEQLIIEGNNRAEMILIGENIFIIRDILKELKGGKHGNTKKNN